MNNYYYTFTKLSVLVIFSFFSLNIFSQTTEIVSHDNKTFVIEYNRSNQVRITPSSGSDFLLNNTVYKNPVSKDNVNGLTWVLKYTGPGSYDFRDVSFANSQTGYICSEYGGVFKTTNRGNNWTQVLALSFPYYWYGIFALNPDSVIVAGFNDQANIHSGVMRWTFNGGTTWTNDISVSIPNGVGWLSRVHFFDQNTGIVSNEWSGGIYYTTNGGKDSASWHYVLVNSDMGWFEGNIDADTNGNIFTTGIHFAHSTNYGQNWTSGPSADGTFDGGVDFIETNLLKGITGGGSIIPSVAGWIHRTTDGGQTWSTRLYNFPWPIRSVKYFSDSLLIAFGGNISSSIGGIFSSTNAGTNWNQDINTGAEMLSYDYYFISSDSMDIWAVGGIGGSYNGVAYKATFGGNPVGVRNISTQVAYTFRVFQNHPNPFNPSTTIRFSIPELPLAKGACLPAEASAQAGGMDPITLKIYDILGREVATLVNQNLQPGDYSITWNASNYPSGVYFYKLTAGNNFEVKKMLLIK